MPRWRSWRSFDAGMILCCGEALIDLIPEGGLFRPVPGGSVFNTALGLGRLGVRTGFLWPLSDDGFGRQLRGLLTGAGVDLRFAPGSARPTALAVVSVRDGQARYDFHDEGSASRDLTADSLPVLPDAVRAIFIGGISLVPDATAAAVNALLDRAGDRLIVLDPNIRPQFIPDLPAHRARIEALAARAHIVKLSADDARTLWPGADHAGIAARLRGLGATLVVITLGPQGAEAFGPQARIRCPAPVVAVIDSIGAGDCFNAGMLAHLATGDLLTPAALAGAGPGVIRALLTAGIEVASLSVTRQGADPPWAHEMRP